jgi:hypothetical protein
LQSLAYSTIDSRGLRRRFRKGLLDLSKICIFVGPTRLQRIPDQAHIFAPAALGSVFRAVLAGYKVICVIDGYFGNVPSVWQKEILFALKGGVTVCGASSMGALRAAELHAFGMVGFGWVYRAFRRGVLQDDDEVCVLHAVPELNFEALSEAMVNIRYSLKRMRNSRLISRESEMRIASSLKELHFSKRNLPAVRSAFEHEFGNQGAAKFALYENNKVDIKGLDAQLMLNAVLSSPIPCKNDGWQFPATNHWLKQFLAQDGDIPPISRWHPTCDPIA